MAPNKFLWLVLSALNLYPSRSTGHQFKIFKISLLQVWSRFAIFGEIHSFFFPKILRKFIQPPDTSRDPLTKSQLKKNFPRASNISSSSLHALFLSSFRVQCYSSGFSVVFFSRPSPISPVPRLASCSLLLLLILAPHGRLAGRGRRC